MPLMHETTVLMQERKRGAGELKQLPATLQQKEQQHPPQMPTGEVLKILAKTEK
jgi:hypothetical protein